MVVWSSPEQQKSSNPSIEKNNHTYPIIAIIANQTVALSTTWNIDRCQWQHPQQKLQQGRKKFHWQQISRFPIPNFRNTWVSSQKGTWESCCCYSQTFSNSKIFTFYIHVFLHMRQQTQRTNIPVTKPRTRLTRNPPSPPSRRHKASKLEQLRQTAGSSDPVFHCSTHL